MLFLLLAWQAELSADGTRTRPLNLHQLYIDRPFASLCHQVKHVDERDGGRQPRGHRSGVTITTLLPDAGSLVRSVWCGVGLRALSQR